MYIRLCYSMLGVLLFFLVNCCCWLGFLWVFLNENKHESLNTKLFFTHVCILAERKKTCWIIQGQDIHVKHTNDNLTSLQQNYKSNNLVSPASRTGTRPRVHD